MAKKQQPCDCPKCMPGWLAAFGDLMSLLLCFFVLLLSMSSMDARKIEDAIGSLAGALSVLDGGSKTEISREKQQQDNPIKKDEHSSSTQNAQSIQNLQKSIEQINEMLQSTGSPEVVIKESENGFVIALPASLLFKPSSAKITNDDALLFLRRIALIIKKMPQSMKIDITGYTDNELPSKSSNFKNNWELSSARAISVLDELVKAKVDPKRLQASARAQFDPIASNSTQEGRAKNRRVQMRFYSMENKDEKKAKQSILDTAK